mmetsp:Transcript_11897/g.37214  ORF Transcript_11897/g.37214 Transcript_11897/m.37214 type:complete len:520 (+) Transcript_11897:220-1779(+)
MLWSPRLRRPGDSVADSPSMSDGAAAKASCTRAAFCGVGLARMRRRSCPGEEGNPDAAAGISASWGSSFARRFRKDGTSSVTTAWTRGCTSMRRGVASSPAAPAPCSAAPAPPRPVMPATSCKSCGSNSRRPKRACSTARKSALSLGTSSVVRCRSRNSASITLGVGISEWATCCNNLPRSVQICELRRPSSCGRSASAAQAHRQRCSSSALVSTGVVVASLEADAPRFSTARKWAALSASRRRSYTCNTMLTSDGIVAPLARFLAGGAEPLAFLAAAASRASRTWVACWQVRASPSSSRTGSAKLEAGRAACAEVLAASATASSPSPSAAVALPSSVGPSTALAAATTGTGSRCSKCSARRTMRPRIRGHASAAGPNSKGSGPAPRQVSARPALKAPQSAVQRFLTTCFSVSALSGRMLPRMSLSRKTASTTETAPAVSSAAGCRCPRRVAAARRRSHAGSSAVSSMPQRTAVRMKAVRRCGAQRAASPPPPRQASVSSWRTSSAVFGRRAGSSGEIA